MRAALAAVPGVGCVRALDHDDLAAAALPLRAAKAAVRAARGRATLPRQLLLDQQGAARSRLPTAVHHRSGDARLHALLRRALRRDEGADARRKTGEGRRAQSGGLTSSVAVSWSDGPGDV